MKAFLLKLLKNKAMKSLSENEGMPSLSPFFKFAIFGGSGFTFFLLIVIVICVIVFAPVFLSEEYFGKNTDASAYDYCGDSCGENETKFYSKLNEVKESYKSRGINIDTNLISGTVFYGSTISSESFDPDDPDSDSLIDDSKIHVSDVKSLASNMVSGSSLDYNKYREYLVNTYIPKRFSDLYSSDKGIEKIADEIMSYASYKETDIASSGSQSYLSILCPEICTTDGDCWGLEDYVSRVVSAESGFFDSFTDNYVEEWKAQAVAARTVAIKHTNYCKNPIENSQNVQVADRSNNIKQSIIDAVKETEGKVLTYEGEVTSASYDSFYKGNNYHCDDQFCYATYNKTGGGSVSSSHEIKAYKKWESSFAGGHGNGMSQFGAAYLADTGMKYEEILKYFYDDDVEISFIGGTMGLGEITEGILFPLGVNSKTGICVSAGNYYPGGSYHGAVDIAGAMMGYSKPYEEIPIVSSTPGVITGLVNNAWCSDTRFGNGDTRLPRIPGCSGNYVIILNDDSSSKYYNYRFIYYHFDSVDSNLKVGDHVQAGQMLGYMGSTGNSTGYHLHYGIKDPSGANLNTTPVPDAITGLIKSYCANNKEENK